MGLAVDVSATSHIDRHNIILTAHCRCTFALDQNGDIAEQVALSVLDSPFVAAIRQCDRFVVNMNCRTEVHTRIWCVAEIYIAKECEESFHHGIEYVGQFNLEPTEQVLISSPCTCTLVSAR